MGYACPVCDDPQADTTHLANHLAFTALVRGGDHEDWLDERVPDWESMDESTLGERLADGVEETEYPQVFEDTTGQDHDHDHANHGQQAGGNVPDAMLQQAADRLADEELPDADEVLQEAQEMTRKRRDGDSDESEHDDTATDDSETE